jgi:PAS domain S-box-containing protein
MPTKLNIPKANGNRPVDENPQTKYQNGSLASFIGSLEYFQTGVVITDAVGIPINYNQIAVETLGDIPLNIAPGDWVKRYGFYLNEGMTPFTDEDFPLYAVLRGEASQTKEIYLKNDHIRDGKWLSVSARKLTSGDGETVGAIIYVNDITDAKQTEVSYQRKIKLIEAASILQQQIAEISNDPLKILNLVVSLAVEHIGDGCIAALLNLPADKLKVVAFHHERPWARKLWYGSLMAQEFGLANMINRVVHSGESLLIQDFNPEDLVKLELTNYLKYAEDIGVQSALIVPIKGRSRVLGTLTLVRDRGGKPYTTEDQTFMTDIAYRTGLAIDNNYLINLLRVETSGRRYAEEALELSEARFRSIFTYTALGIKLLDLKSNILETNPAFQTMLGYTAEELRGKRLPSLWHPADAKAISQVLEKLVKFKQQSSQIEHRLICKDHSIVWVNVTYSGIKKNDREESLAFIVAIVENITGRKQIEAEMTRMKSRLQSHVELERLRLAQELHDGPLQDLYSAIYKIENWGQLVKTGDIEKIDELKQDLLGIIQGLRNTAKDLRPPTLAEFGLEKAIRSHAEEFQEKHPQIHINLHLAHDGKLLSEDIRLILFRIYQHTIMNVLRHADACDVNINFSFDAEEAKLEIQDNGTGFVVPTNWMELVREGHYGLAGAVERVSLLDGTFTVDSEPGVGTTVKVMIPIANDSILADQAEE